MNLTSSSGCILTTSCFCISCWEEDHLGKRNVWCEKLASQMYIALRIAVQMMLLPTADIIQRLPRMFCLNHSCVLRQFFGKINHY